MKNILLNKKWLNVMALLLFILTLSSCCSAVGYWAMPDADYPVIEEVMLEGEKLGFWGTLNAVLWAIAIIGKIAYWCGVADDTYGGHHSVKIDGKWHNYYNPEEARTIAGTGSPERGHRWGNLLLGIFLYIAIFILIIKGLKCCFDKLNLLFIVILALIYIASIINVHPKIVKYIGFVKQFAWRYFIIDCILGLIILLYKTTV